MFYVTWFPSSSLGTQLS